MLQSCKFSLKFANCLGKSELSHLENVTSLGGLIPQVELQIAYITAEGHANDVP